MKMSTFLIAYLWPYLLKSTPGSVRITRKLSIIRSWLSIYRNRQKATHICIAEVPTHPIGPLIYPRSTFQHVHGFSSFLQLTLYLETKLDQLFRCHGMHYIVLKLLYLFSSSTTTCMRLFVFKSWCSLSWLRNPLPVAKAKLHYRVQESQRLCLVLR
jgi:hypothetical protein